MGAVDCMSDPDLWLSPKSEDIAAATTACETCPIAFECLDYALSVERLDGVWGSSTPAERKYLSQIGAEPKGR